MLKCIRAFQKNLVFEKVLNSYWILFSNAGHSILSRSWINSRFGFFIGYRASKSFSKLAAMATAVPAEKTTDPVAECQSSANATCGEFSLEEKGFVASAEASGGPGIEGSREFEPGIASDKKPKKYRGQRQKSDNRRRPERPKRIAPNYFIAIQVTNPEIHKKLGEIQDMVVKVKPLLREALVNLKTLHITLMVMYLRDEDIGRAKTALDSSKERILEHGLGDVELQFSGIGDFRQTVVFAKVQEGPELDRLKKVAEMVRNSFAEQELFSTEDRDFAAHLTIMKLSKNPRLFYTIKKIDRSFYADVKDETFGLQPFVSLQLCAMEKAENGYYPIEYEVFFGAQVSGK